MDIIQHNLLVKTKRKWKSRWVVLRRVNPASARINLYIYKDRLSAISKHKEKFLLSLREFCGMESIDKENKSPKLVIITASQPLSLRFESKSDRDHWVDTIVTEGNFGEDVSFDGIVPSKHTLKSGEVTLHIYPDFFTLVRKQNSRCLGRWNFEQLFNYGTVEGGFVFRVENDAEKGAEPESFFLLTSWEKQINRTFDTVYKTARHMYGSAEGLQRPSKLNSPSGPRPRSMSEPSGFKRFMHRLSFRRKSRRPKNSKLKAGNFKRRSDDGDGNPTTPDGSNLSEDGGRKGISENVAADRLEDKLSSKSLSDDEHQAGETSSGATSALCFESTPSGSVLVDVRQDPTNDACDGAEYLDKSTERKKANGIERAASSPGATGHSPGSLANTASNNSETERGRDSGSIATKKSHDMTEALSDRDSETRIQQQLGREDDVTVWQRKSALFLNTDDMIQQGFIKSKTPGPRRSSTGDSSAEGYEGNNNSSMDDAAVPRESAKGTAIQARRNTSSLGGKRPMLTIEITPSGSEPSLNQYVNVPEAFKSKQIHKLKQGEWDKYDSEENVYHHLAAVVGPQLGYQNVPGEARSRSVNSLNNSYQNYPGPSEGHSYENVAGGRGNMHYINVEAKTKPQQSVNYIKVSGSGPPTPIQKNSSNSFVSRKQSSDYAEIDTMKTQRLREMAKETKERVKKS